MPIEDKSRAIKNKLALAVSVGIYSLRSRNICHIRLLTQPVVCAYVSFSRELAALQCPQYTIFNKLLVGVPILSLSECKFHGAYTPPSKCV